ncbi:MAG TPA: restriction endonuclease subunit S, partial [Clostridiaceae bacterium]|nr:restriction endonuclease subunit S [Clostridiaceae bacterium]
IKQGKIKRDKKESVIFKGDDNSYYQDLPNGWSVCKLCEISYFERGITFPASAKEASPTGRNIACARTANVQDSFDISNLIYVDKSFMKDNPDKLLKVNDIIVSTANSLELVGKSCIVEKLLEKMTFGGFVTVIRGIGINHKYIHMCLKNKFLKGEFSYKSTQTTNIANISTKDLAETLIYLPPLAEQERIVNAVETLFTQIDKISEQIS